MLRMDHIVAEAIAFFESITRLKVDVNKLKATVWKEFRLPTGQPHFRVGRSRLLDPEERLKVPRHVHLGVLLNQP